MRRNIIGLCLILVSISFGCTMRRPKVADSSQSVSVEDKVTALTPLANKAIKDCLDYISEVGIRVLNNETLINLVLMKEGNNDCYLIVFIQPFYDKTQVKGYTYWSDYTVVYYGIDEVCAKSFLDMDKMLINSDSIPGFPDINNYRQGHYDPYGIKYRVLSSDSLQVIYKGML